MIGTMMKRNAMVAILALATAFVCSAEDDNSDEKIKRLIVGSNFYIDNPDASYRMFMNARRRCGTDTNRFARLLAEVAQTNNNWERGGTDPGEYVAVNMSLRVKSWCDILRAE